MTAPRGELMHTGGLRSVVALLIGLIVAVARTANAQLPPPPSASPPAPVVAAPVPSPAPVIASPSAPPAAATPASDSEFAFSGLSDVTAPTNGDAPYMIGDFFIGSGQIVFVGQPDSAANLKTGVVGQVPSAGGSGRAKISDDNCVFPEDRVFFYYNYFDNAILIPSPSPHALDVNRYTPGFEKTFWDHNASIEMRIPFAGTQASDVNLGGGKDEDLEFGDLELVLKFLLWKGDYFAAAGGLGFNAPTAAPVRVFENAASATPLFTIDNDAFHLLPYFGVLYTPSENLFVQTFVEFDIDTNGNEVKLPIPNGDVGTLRDQNLLQVDVQTGLWLWREPNARWITGLAPTVEYHYTTTINNAKFVTVQSPIGPFVLGNQANRVDIHNLTLGVEMLLGSHSTLNIAGVVPLDKPTSDNRQFDAEYFVQFNRFF
jgi:hypothetical protein